MAPFVGGQEGIHEARGGVPTSGLEPLYTVDDAARLCIRSPKTIRNLISKHQLPRFRVRGPGRNPRRIVVLTARTVRRLRVLTLRL